MSAFTLSDEEAQVGATARSFLGDFVDNEYLNEQQDGPTGYDDAVWRRMCDLGWTGLHLPARVGGADGTLVDAALIAREVGRAALAGPLLQVLRVGTALTTLTTDKAFDDVLERVAGGAVAVLVAPPDRTVLAESTGDGLLLRGSCVVEWFAQCEAAVLLVPTEDGSWACAVVPRERLGGRAVEVPSVDNERMSRLDLDGVELPADLVLATGIAEHAARYALARADLLRASAMVGGCQAVVERTARYALERHQFGQPIGGFQAVRHHLARMVIAADGAQLLCDDALTRAVPDGEEYAIAAAAVFAAGRSYVDIVLTAAQVHGGVGTTVEHVLHHHFRRAKAMQLRGGRRASRLRELHRALVVDREARVGSLW